ncbi:hypothetical protein FLA_1537 [Filimonas lacunae]|nr:hypothetical protein FLA_1537 [Filimonas lacunae]
MPANTYPVCRHFTIRSYQHALPMNPEVIFIKLHQRTIV